MNRLLTLAFLVLLALLPAVLFYYLFGELNKAGVEWSGKSVQLGGPVAAFFAILWFLGNMFRKMSPPNSLQKHLEGLAGAWAIESESQASRRQARSTTVMKIENGALRIEGGVFREVANEGDEGKSIGDWNTEIAVFDGYRLLYVYNLSDSQLEQWKGVVRASLNTIEKTPTFDGTWQVFGPRVHQGKIHMKKLMLKDTP